MYDFVNFWLHFEDCIPVAPEDYSTLARRFYPFSQALLLSHFSQELSYLLAKCEVPISQTKFASVASSMHQYKSKTVFVIDNLKFGSWFTYIVNNIKESFCSLSSLLVLKILIIEEHGSQTTTVPRCILGHSNQKLLEIKSRIFRRG